ncbi:hypothetical protein N5923_08755 [Erwiniaceae bacterium BAC15a-03b]|uniref:Uncharacterized protein n=1 Tax=Winslowiella arboricola TaxID=2978220 RepID=A0A9J6PS78_9GAMM|nr:hypothetical protein [Winslowiella arboricola]MCU5771749.1 hypothetical protein [Winslowiella arboricola]MCU5777580.1 hypothetical protein [Winslowiella arboricola]
MNEVEFSVQSDTVSLLWLDPQQRVELAGGYATVADGLLKGGKVTAWDVEMMIYRIEEIIESDHAVQPIRGDALCRDPLLKQVSDSYLAGARVLFPPAIEEAFNQFADQLSYSAIAVDAENIPALTGFIFIREMVHHLDIRKITLR